jgi:small subunit ribosomal protein S15
MALTKVSVGEIVKGFGRHATDSGGTEVQIALLTEEIGVLTKHMQTFPKDFASRRGMLKKVAQRKKLLNYLSDQDLQRYNALKKKLELK